MYITATEQDKEYFLLGKLKCGECGNNLVAANLMIPLQEYTEVYSCTTGCVMLNKNELESAIIDDIKKNLFNIKKIDKLVENAKMLYAKHIFDMSIELFELRAQVLRLKGIVSTLRYTGQQETEKMYETLVALEDSELQLQHKERLMKIEISEETLEKDIKQEILKQQISLKDKRALIKKTLTRVIAYKNHTDIYYISHTKPQTLYI